MPDAYKPATTCRQLDYNKLLTSCQEFSYIAKAENNTYNKKFYHYTTTCKHLRNKKEQKKHETRNMFIRAMLEALEAGWSPEMTLLPAVQSRNHTAL